MDAACTIFQMIQEQSLARPDAPAILAPGKEALSYLALAEHLGSAALELSRSGIRAGDRVALVLPNGAEMATAFLAASAVCACAPLNPGYQLEEFRFSLRDLRVKVLITDRGADHPCRLAAADLGLPVILLQPDEQAAGLFRWCHDLPLDGALDAPLLAGLEDIGLVLHTSGTTSRPKIVPVTRRTLFNTTWNFVETYALQPGDRCLNMMPLFHISALANNLAASLFSGGSVICAPGFSAPRILAWLTDLSPTWYSAVPSIQQAVLDQVQQAGGLVGRSHLRFIRSVSAALPPQLGRELEEALGVPVVEAFGMTEGNNLFSNPLPPRAHKFGSIGLPTPGNQAAIYSTQGQPLPENMEGEIWVRGISVISAYENDPQANQASFVEGWLRTGDLGVMDSDGYFYIRGRLKEQINRGGEKVNPREVDEILLEHDAVKQAAAFAVPHPTLGEDIAAAVVLKPGQAATQRELRQFAAGRLADFKVPRLVVFVADIPKGPTGKIQRILLAEKLKAELDAARAHDPAEVSRPRTPLEAQVLAIWQAVLGQSAIGVQDDFLALGGDSFMAARVLFQIQQQLGENLTIMDLFAAPTVEAMAQRIQELRGM